VLAKGGAHLLLQDRDLLAERADDLGQRHHRRAVSGAQFRWLGKLRSGQCSLDRGGFVRDVAATGPLQRRSDLRLRQPGSGLRLGRAGSSSKVSGADRSAKAASAAGKYSRSMLRSRSTPR
jgi:hypothetical protein